MSGWHLLNVRLEIESTRQQPRPMSEPFRLRTKIRRHLPWFLIDRGLCAKGKDCEESGGSHEWYNQDDDNSACYHCSAVRPGQLWDSSEASSDGPGAGPASPTKLEAEQDEAFKP